MATSPIWSLMHRSDEKSCQITRIIKKLRPETTTSTQGYIIHLFPGTTHHTKAALFECHQHPHSNYMCVCMCDALRPCLLCIASWVRVHIGVCGCDPSRGVHAAMCCWCKKYVCVTQTNYAMSHWEKTNVWFCVLHWFVMCNKCDV